MFLLMEDLLQDRRLLFVRVPVLQLVAVSGSVLLFPSAPAAFATGIVVAAFLVGMAFLLRWTYLAVPKALVLGSIWVGGTWLLPLLVDYMIIAVNDSSEDTPARPIASITTSIAS
jgi:RsiW-degrading membrane proteinase PrsW (M82 family)